MRKKSSAFPVTAFLSLALVPPGRRCRLAQASETSYPQRSVRSHRAVVGGLRLGYLVSPSSAPDRSLAGAQLVPVSGARRLPLLGCTLCTRTRDIELRDIHLCNLIITITAPTSWLRSRGPLPLPRLRRRDRSIPAWAFLSDAQTPSVRRRKPACPSLSTEARRTLALTGSRSRDWCIP